MSRITYDDLVFFLFGIALAGGFIGAVISVLSTRVAL